MTGSLLATIFCPFAWDALNQKPNEFGSTLFLEPFEGVLAESAERLIFYRIFFPRSMFANSNG